MDTHMDTLRTVTDNDLAVIDQIKAEAKASATKLLSALPQSTELRLAVASLEAAEYFAVQTVVLHGTR